MIKSLVLTNEYPPHVYGGAGVHVDHLSRELAKIMRIDVRCFGRQSELTGNLSVHGYPLERTEPSNGPIHLLPTLQAIMRDCQMTAHFPDADVVHCHTWYTHLAGVLIKLLYGLPLVITVHSLEPLRPWKREQLGRGYDFSSWIEKTALEMADAIIAVSQSTKKDITAHFPSTQNKISVIYNGVDMHVHSKRNDPNTLKKYGVDPTRPFVLFVGRITHQKGLAFFLEALPAIDPGLSIVICAGAPDTSKIQQETEEKLRIIQKQRDHITWIREMLPKEEAVVFFSHASIFCCPSIYEPFGIINLEAMACETAVVASHVGGIPEIVIPGETGLLVPYDASRPQDFSKGLADAINQIHHQPILQQSMARKGKQRVETLFLWSQIAEKTKALYTSLCKISQ